VRVVAAAGGGSGGGLNAGSGGSKKGRGYLQVRCAKAQCSGLDQIRGVWEQIVIGRQELGRGQQQRLCSALFCSTLLSYVRANGDKQRR
jgi:hypothetical protein